LALVRLLTETVYELSWQGIRSRYPHVSALAEALMDDYYIDKEMVLAAVRQQTCFNVIHMNNAFKVDIFIIEDRELNKMAFW
jgi:hypothetical protein